MGRKADETRRVKSIKITIENCWGEWEYTVSLRRLRGEDWPRVVVQFEREGKKGEGKLKHTVENLNGKVCCSCPDEEGHQLPGGCKHVGVLRYLLGGLEDLWLTNASSGWNGETQSNGLTSTSPGWKTTDAKTLLPASR